MKSCVPFGSLSGLNSILFMRCTARSFSCLPERFRFDRIPMPSPRPKGFVSRSAQVVPIGVVSTMPLTRLSRFSGVRVSAVGKLLAN